MIKFLHKKLLQIDPETAHNLAIACLPLAPVAQVVQKDETTLFGLRFKNKIGLGAGLDKNGDALGAWDKMGFGFIEVGTVTPKPQIGNPKPRIFRLPEAQAIINRMGFNNKGIDNLIDNVKRYRLNQSQEGGALIGINIGKNAVTPIENAADDYLICLKKAYPYADYITINISSPNTKNLRALQEGALLKDLLNTLKKEQSELTKTTGKYVPLLVKIAPDMTDQDCVNLAETLLEQGIDGVIATNTTVTRDQVETLQHSNEMGGLSGRPLFERSTEIVRVLYGVLGEKVPIIAMGGIADAATAQAKLDAGAKLIQLYTGFIYAGPQLIQTIADQITSA